MIKVGRGGGHRSPLAGLLLFVVVGTAGCARLLDIHHRSLILGLGIDRGPGPGWVTVSAQAIHPKEVPLPGGGGSGVNQWKTIVGDGSTLHAALTIIQGKTDRQVFLGELGVIVLGTPLASEEDGALHDLDTVERSPQVPETTEVVVATGTAEALLQKGTKNSVIRHIRSFITQPRTGVAVLDNAIWSFLAQSLDIGKATYAPRFAPDPGAEGMRYEGTALFHRGRLVGTLSPQMSAALSWLVRRSGFGGLAVGSGRDEWTVAIHSAYLHWNLGDPAQPSLSLGLTGEVTGTPRQVPAPPPATLEQQAALAATREVRGLIRLLQRDGTDVLGIGERLRERGVLPPGPWAPHFRRLKFSESVRVRLVPGKMQ